MKGLVRMMLSTDSARRTIVNNSPRFRRFCASVLGLGHALPLEYEGTILRAEHLSIDFNQSQHRGPIFEWYQQFVPLLEREIFRYPHLGSLSQVMHEHGLWALPIHFHPITDDHAELHLTTSYVDGDIEKPFFAYLRQFAASFVEIYPPPLRMYCLLELDPQALQSYLRVKRPECAA